MRAIFCLLPLALCLLHLESAGQKMLLLERANRAKTTKLYIGDRLEFRLAGEEDYWYQRTITDILPASNLLLLDNFPVKVDSIVALRVRRRPVWRLVGGTLFAGGASLALATTVGAIYGDKDVQYGPLYVAAAGGLGAGAFLSTKRKLKLGKKFRLRIIEIDFGPPLIAPPPGKQK